MPRAAVGSALSSPPCASPDLSSCEVSGSLTDWRMSNEIAMADSTNDLYQLQVSPLGSSSEGWCCFLPTSFSQHSPGAMAGWRQGCRGAKQELLCRKSSFCQMDLGF